MTAPVQPFLAAQVTLFRPDGAAVVYRGPWGSKSWGSLSLTAPVVEATAYIYASDAGYRTRSTDAGGVVPYPPVMSAGLSIDRRIALEPGAAAAGWGWGTLTLANDADQYSALLAVWNVDGRAIEIRYGEKTYDATRGVFVDPALASLTLAFKGMARPWSLTANQLQIPLRDASYWLEKPVHTDTYAGTGTYEGTAAMLGMYKPKLRGAAYNIQPVLVDPTNLIYQANNAATSFQALYEGGATSITFQADTANLYIGSTTAGQYRTDTSRGLLQLGSTPVRTITCDATGYFPVAGLKTIWADIARHILSEDLALPAAFIDTSSFTTAATNYYHPAGVYFSPSDAVDGAAAVGRLLISVGAKLIPKRSGALSVTVLRTIPPGTTPAYAFTADNVVSLVPVALPAILMPPPYRLRVGYQHNYTVQTGDLSASATATQRAFIAAADRLASWSSGTVLLAYTRPSDPAPFGGALTVQGDAQAIADALGALWGVRRRLFDMTLPMSIGISRDIGDVVQITYPLDDMANGQLGQIIGEQFRPNDATITFQVLI